MNTKVCQYCHEPFTDEGGPIGKRKYCPPWTGRECAALMMKQQNRASKRIGRVTLICQDCREPFPAATTKTKYCLACRKNHFHPGYEPDDDELDPDPADEPIAEVPIVLPEAVTLAVEPKVGRLAMGARCRGCKSPLFWHDSVLCTACQIVQYRTGRDIIKAGVLV